MRSWLLLLMAALGGGLGGFFLGKVTSPQGSSGAASGETLQTNGGLLGAKPAEAGRVTPQRRAEGSASSGGARFTTAALRRELETIKTDSNPINRFASLTRLLDELSPENLDTVLQAFDEIPMRYEHRQEYQMLIYAWASFDPEAALKFVGENANRRSINESDLLRPLVASWASNDPDETLAWLETLPEERQKDQNLLSGLMQGWAAEDPYAAATYLQENIEPGQKREQLAGEIASHLFKQDPSEAATWAEAQKDLKFREEAFEELAEDWASVNPQALANWLGEHVEEAYSVEAFEDLARSWVSQDPDAATAYFENLPDGQAKESGIYEMARTWGQDDLGALGEWLNGLPDSNVTDLGVKAYVERLAEQAPQAAIESAMSINTDAMRDEAVMNVGRQWFLRDPDAATAWAGDHGIPIESFQPQHPEGAIQNTIFSADGARVISAGENGAIRVWDAASGESILTREGALGEGETLSLPPTQAVPE